MNKLTLGAIIITVFVLLGPYLGINFFGKPYSTMNQLPSIKQNQNLPDLDLMDLVPEEDL